MSRTSHFGAWLKERRKVFDIRQEDLAGMIGCSPKTIEKIESGERRPSRQVADLLAGHLGVPADERQAFIHFSRFEQNYGQLGDAVPGDQNGNPAPWRSHYRYQTNLPATPAPLIGRDEDIEQVAALLQKERVRLLTLIGSPGIGKTSLGVAVADEVLDRFEDGVFMVLLASISDPALFVGELARTLGVQEAGRETIPSLLIRFLQSKRTLLLLDNFEQVAGAAIYVSDLIAACPWLKVLVTSRTALHVRGERRFYVRPLAVPDPGQHHVEAISESPAVALFVERAQGVKPDFELTEDNASTVASMCARLDGVPLAIELAAARVKLLPPHALLSKLTQPLALLTNGSLDLPTRQQTLRNAISWSYDLLSDAEQTLFARLGVFVGGCTLSAAEAVCNAAGDLPFSALEGVGSLLDKSLLQGKQDEGTDSERIFSMLETIREYAVECLTKDGEIDRIRRLHAEYYLAFAEAAEPELGGREQVAWFNRLELEHDNIRAVLQWTQDSRSSLPGMEIGLRTASAMYTFWMVRGQWSEARQWLEFALTNAAKRGPDKALARAIVRLGKLTWHMADFEAAGKLADKGLAMCYELGDKAGIAEALLAPGFVPAEGALSRARVEESLALFQGLNDSAGMSRALYNLAQLALDQGSHSQTRMFAEQSLALDRERGDRWGAAFPIGLLGYLLLLDGRCSAARGLFEECLALHREVGHKRLIARTLTLLGQAARMEGDYSCAEEMFKESLTLFNELGAKRQVAECVTGLAQIACEQSKIERAATLFGASEVLRQAIKYVLESAEQSAFERGVIATRAQLTASAFDDAWTIGCTLTEQQAVAYALEPKA